LVLADLEQSLNLFDGKAHINGLHRLLYRLPNL
jgi:hypothetical protein